MAPNERHKPWTIAQVALMEQMQAEGKSWEEISLAVNHPKHSCQTRHSEMKRWRREGKVPKASTVTAVRPIEPRCTRGWTPEEDAIVLARCGISDEEIHAVAKQLKRSYWATRQRFYTKRRPPKEHPTIKTVRMAAEHRAEAARLEPLRYASPFAEMLGEPPIGRRALDKRQEGRLR